MNDCWRLESSPDVSIRRQTHPIRVYLAATQSQSWLVIIEVVSSQIMGEEFLQYIKKMQKECGEATNSFLSEVLYSQNVDIDGH